MTPTIRCPQGHVWDSTTNATLVPDAPAQCPICGSMLNEVTPCPDGTLNTSENFTAGSKVLTNPKRFLPPRSPSRLAIALPGYELLEELGRGGMGVVFKARHITLKRLVALKMILGGDLAGEQQRLRFKKEAEAVARLQHPNIVQVFDVGEHDGYPYFSLELVDGGTLAAKLRNGPLQPRTAARLMETLARAVHYAHEQGLVHRDLKPANILLTKDGTPKITDFGLAKHMDQEDQATRTGVIAGTPNYMAPEQASGRTDLIGPRSDVCALGAILYELLTGQPPFSGGSAIEVIYRVVHEEPAPPRSFQPRLPRDLEIISLKCLSKAVHHRYGSAAELADDLRRFLDHEPIQARPISTSERLIRQVRRHPAAAAMMVGLLVAAAAWGTVVVGRYRDRQEQQQAIVKDATGLVERIRVAVGQADWDRASELFTDFNSEYDSQQLPENLRSEAARLNEEVQQRLRARDTYRRFLALCDEALFLAAPGVTPKVHEKARQAIEMVGYHKEGKWTPTKEFSDAQASDILCGVFELLVLTAPEGGVDAVRAAARRASDEFKRERGDSDANRRIFVGLDLYLAGLDYFQHGRHDAALESFVAALLARPDHYWARYYQALCYVRLGHRPELVRDALTVCLSQRSDVVWPYLQRGFAHAQLGLYDAAEKDFQVAEKLLGDRPDPEARYVLLNNRAVARLGQERIDAALVDLDQATRIKPEMYHAFLTLAQAYHHKRDTGRALKNLDEAIARADRLRKSNQVSAETMAILYRTRAHWQVERKNVAAALHDLDQSIELEREPPTRARLLRDKAQLLARQGRFEEAVQAFEATLALTPHDAEVLLARAECFLNLKQWEKAEEGFTHVLAASTKPAAKTLAYRATARLRRTKPNIRGAITDLTLALDLEPENLTWRTQRGEAAMMVEDWSTAVADFDAVLARQINRVEARLLRAQALLKLGRPDAAVRDAESVLKKAVLKPSQIYGAATIFARAAGLMDRTSETSTHAARERFYYQARALDALNHLFESLPPDKRTAFWRDYPARDAALVPVRTSEDFRQLERAYAGQPESR